MKRIVDERAMPVVVSRSDIRRRSDRHLPNHGFFNDRNASLPEVPLRSWGRSGVSQREAASFRPEQKR